LPTTKTTH